MAAIPSRTILRSAWREPNMTGVSGSKIDGPRVRLAGSADGGTRPVGRTTRPGAGNPITSLKPAKL